MLGIHGEHRRIVAWRPPGYRSAGIHQRRYCRKQAERIGDGSNWGRGPHTDTEDRVDVLIWSYRIASIYPADCHLRIASIAYGVAAKCLARLSYCCTGTPETSLMGRPLMPSVYPQKIAPPPGTVHQSDL
jgi:hypothetical protein